MSVSGGSSIRHAGLHLSPICIIVGLRPSMWVSDGLSIRHVGIRRGMSVLDGSPI